MSPPLHVEASSTPASLPSRPPDPCTVVLFGATGDLAHRKIVPALYDLARSGELPSPFGVVATSTSVGPAEAYRAQLRQSVERFSGAAVDEATWSAFAAGIDTIAGDYTKPEAWSALREAIAGAERRRATAGNRLFYLAVPPASFPPILAGLRDAGLLHPPNGDAVVAGRDREALRPRPRLGAGAQLPRGGRPRRAADLPHRPLPRQGDGPEHPRLPLRQLDLRAALEPQVRRPGPDHDGGGDRDRAAREVLRRDRRRARRRPEPPAAAPRPRGHGAPGHLRGRRHPRREAEAPALGAAALAVRRRARAVRRVPRGGGRRDGLAHAHLRGAALPRGQLALAGRALLRPGGQGPRAAHHRGRRSTSSRSPSASSGARTSASSSSRTCSCSASSRTRGSPSPWPPRSPATTSPWAACTWTSPTRTPSTARPGTPTRSCSSTRCGATPRSSPGATGTSRRGASSRRSSRAGRRPPDEPAVYERGSAGPREADALPRQDGRRWRPLAGAR